jgi:hypothetical protein
VDNLANVSILKSTNGAIEFESKNSTSTDSKSIIFDDLDNIISLSSNGTWGGKSRCNN